MLTCILCSMTKTFNWSCKIEDLLLVQRADCNLSVYCKTATRSRKKKGGSAFVNKMSKVNCLEDKKTPKEASQSSKKLFAFLIWQDTLFYAAKKRCCIPHTFAVLFFLDEDLLPTPGSAHFCICPQSPFYMLLI